MTHFTNEIKMPANKSEGLQNFVQMIINTIEAGDINNALLLAVDLHQDLSCDVYKEVVAPDLTDASVPMSEHLRAVQAAADSARNEGYNAGCHSVRMEFARALGRAGLAGV